MSLHGLVSFADFAPPFFGDFSVELEAAGFSLFSSAALITYAMHGLATAQVWALALFITPTCILGMWLGSKAVGLAKETTYRRTAYVIVAFSAIAGLPLWDHLY
jgi:uncharacterized membrane protein YfcA